MGLSGVVFRCPAAPSGFRFREAFVSSKDVFTENRPLWQALFRVFSIFFLLKIKNKQYQYIAFSLRTPFLPAPGPVSDFFDQAGLGKGPEKLVELVPDASFRDAGEGLGQQGGGLVPRKR